LSWRIFDSLCQCCEWLWHSLFYLLNVNKPWGSRFIRKMYGMFSYSRSAALVVCCLCDVLTYCRLMQRLFKLSQQWLQSSWPLM
jgi:hypothetical protein